MKHTSEQHLNLIRTVIKKLLSFSASKYFEEQKFMKYRIVYKIRWHPTFEKRARIICMIKRLPLWDYFPGGPVVKNSPANTGDTGSIPGPGRHPRPRSSWAPAPQLPSSGVR